MRLRKESYIEEVAIKMLMENKDINCLVRAYKNTPEKYRELLIKTMESKMYGN